MTEIEIRKVKQAIHKAILDSLPENCTDKEMMYIYQSIAYMLLTETTAWAYEDIFVE